MNNKYLLDFFAAAKNHNKNKPPQPICGGFLISKYQPTVVRVFRNTLKALELSVVFWYNVFTTHKGDKMFNLQALSSNIKMYRKAKGISQNSLAAALSISSQSVSKWECGVSVPDIENLCMISDVLGVSLDVLLSRSTDDVKVMIGIDGGGTKTEFIMFTEDGVIIEKLLLGPCNPNAIGIEASTEVLVKGINTLLAVNLGVCGIYVGSAGFLLGNNSQQIRNSLKKYYPHIKIRCASDMLNVVASATDAENCVAAICGTGSVVLVKEGDTYTRLGGWGFLLNKSGSGYDIGRDALCAAGAEMDGMGEHTLLTDLIKSKIGDSVSDVVDKVYKNDQSYIASFAADVFYAYHKGDKIAENILRENAESISKIINHAVQNYNCGNKLILSGGIVTKNPEFIEIMKGFLVSNLEIIIPDYAQSLGACVLCAKHCGVSTDGLIEKLAKQY